MSSGSSQVVHYAPETIVGTTPTPFNRQLARFTSFSLDGEPSGTASEEIVDSPMSSGEFKTSLSISGEYVGELTYGTFDDFFAAAFRNNWVNLTDPADGASLVLGTVKKTFSFLRGYKDAGGYHIFSGVYITGLTIEVPEEGIIKVTLTLNGQDRKPVTFSVPVGTVTPATTTKQFTNVSAGDVTLDGQSLADIACVSAFTLSMEWTVESQKCFGKGLSAGKLMQTAVAVTGSATLAFGDKAAQINELKYGDTSISLKIPLTDKEGNEYTIEVPEATVMGSLPSGSRTDLLQYSLEFTARRQSPIITRKPA